MEILEEFTATTVPNGFYWFNKPNSARFGDGLELLTDAQTDFWQRTHYGFQRDNGHCLFTKLTGDFSALTHVSCKPQTQFDQCGLIVRIDKDNWIKVANEYENKEISRLGSVVTNYGFSDWATQDVSSDLKEMWYRISRSGNDYLIEYALDGMEWTQMRITHLHATTDLVEVGIFACSPIGSELRCRFSVFQVTENKWLE